MRYYELSEHVRAQGGRLLVTNATARGLRVQVRKRVGRDRHEIVVAEGYTGDRGTLDDAAAECEAQLRARAAA